MNNFILRQGFFDAKNESDRKIWMPLFNLFKSLVKTFSKFAFRQFSKEITFLIVVSQFF